jgi:regulator of sigma E protease
MVFLENIWWFLVLIGVMILLHELGHFVVARLFDVKVETFSFGFGPRLFGFKHGDTDFRFSALPILGGYVKMAGDQPLDPTGEEVSDPRSLVAKPRWQRLLITLAGPAVNVLLAIVLLTGLCMTHYEKIPTPRDPVVGYLAPDGAAAKAGIHEGDRVVQVDNVLDPNWDEISIKELESAQHPMQVWVMRAGERLHFTVVPALDPKEGIGVAGWGQETQVQVGSVAKGMEAQRVGLQAGDILISANGEPLRSVSRLYEIEKTTNGTPIDLVYSHNGQRRSVTVTPVKTEVDGQQRWLIGLTVETHLEITKLPFLAAVRESWRWNIQSTKLILQSLELMIERRVSPKSLVGPVGIAAMSGQAAREGAASYFSLMAAVSLNLAIFNLLPIPILDGGGIMMLLVEMLMRRELDLKVKEAVVKVGFVFLMMVVVFVIYNDISKILPG